MMPKEEPEIDAMVFEDPSVEVEMETLGKEDSPFIQKLKESVPEFLFCKPSCTKCYGRQYEHVMADTKEPNVCRKLVNRVNKQARIQAALQTKLVDKVIEEKK